MLAYYLLLMSIPIAMTLEACDYFLPRYLYLDCSPRWFQSMAVLNEGTTTEVAGMISSAISRTGSSTAGCTAWTSLTSVLLESLKMTDSNRGWTKSRLPLHSCLRLDNLIVLDIFSPIFTRVYNYHRCSSEHLIQLLM